MGQMMPSASIGIRDARLRSQMKPSESYLDPLRIDRFSRFTDFFLHRVLRFEASIHFNPMISSEERMQLARRKMTEKLCELTEPEA